MIATQAAGAAERSPGSSRQWIRGSAPLRPRLVALHRIWQRFESTGTLKTVIKHADLPLRYETPAEWAEQVLREPLALLNDHAHLEKKAATNALELLNRFPEPNPPENWVTAMTAVARDEVEHLAVVSRLLARRGGRLSRQHRNEYASRLRDLVRMGTGPGELVDRLMISSLIEARSCERFKLLADAVQDPSAGSGQVDKELAKLYRGLWASEHGHYLSFIQLAEQIQPEKLVAKRWDEMLDAEAKLIQRQPPGPRMHSGVGAQEKR